MDYIVPPRWKAPEEIPGTRIRENNRSYAMYKCCCGNTFRRMLGKSNLSCGCDLYKLSKPYYDYKDNYEKDMGLVLVGVKYEEERRIIATLICHCGSQFETRFRNIKNGHTRSCGNCLKKWEHAPYYGKIDKNPSDEKIKKAIRIIRAKTQRDMEISDKDIKEIIFENCHWLGIGPSKLFFTRKGGETPFYINGIDRIDNDKGYVKNNCVPCSTKANFLKGTFSEKEFLELIKQVYEHRIRNKKTSTEGTRVTSANDPRAHITSPESRQEQTRVA
jgi:hypothetical protein